MINIIYTTSKSCSFQYSKWELAIGRLIIKGIFFSFNSCWAIIRPSIICSATFTNGVAPLFNCFALIPIIFVRSYFDRIGRVRWWGSSISPFSPLIILHRSFIVL